MAHDYIRALARDSETFVCSLDKDPLLGSVISGEAAQQDYVRYLVASYHYVRWSGFLLANTAQGLRRSGRCPALLAAVDQKAVEEGPHDQWLLRDLKTCGVNPELVKGGPIPSAVHAYTAWSLTLAEAGSPAFLGAAYTLEFISMRRAKVASRNLRARMAIPCIDQALRFLDGHGEADHGHIAELESVLEFVENKSDQADITFSSGVMRRLYPHFFALESW
jgi:pyrroloquinoline quinone (PQQ) biosynthesis protein C